MTWAETGATCNLLGGQLAANSLPGRGDLHVGLSEATVSEMAKEERNLNWQLRPRASGSASSTQHPLTAIAATSRNTACEANLVSVWTATALAPVGAQTEMATISPVCSTSFQTISVSKSTLNLRPTAASLQRKEHWMLIIPTRFLEKQWFPAALLRDVLLSSSHSTPREVPTNSFDIFRSL